MTFEEWLGNQIDERNEIYAEIGQECYDNGYQQGRADAERDFQNSDYWNDYLQKIISDAKADAIEEVERAMYHQCFEVNNDEEMQKWDSGNWFRYKLFENVMDKLKGGAENE